MKYVIKREDGKYVTRGGQQSSYTDQLQHAWSFPSRESAERERCPGNERVVEIEQEINNQGQL